jgi:hypothetical protein
VCQGHLAGLPGSRGPEGSWRGAGPALQIRHRCQHAARTESLTYREPLIVWEAELVETPALSETSLIVILMSASARNRRFLNRLRSHWPDCPPDPPGLPSGSPRTGLPMKPALPLITPDHRIYLSKPCHLSDDWAVPSKGTLEPQGLAIRPGTFPTPEPASRVQR